MEGTDVSAEPGGIAAKLGTMYERRFAAELLIDLVAGRLIRLRWEPASGDRDGADIEIERANGSTEHFQLRRQNGSAGKWTVADLDRGGVLRAAADIRSRGDSHHFRFVSADFVPHLKDICDQLCRSADPPIDFVQNRVHREKGRKRAFDELLSKWRLDPTSHSDIGIAIERLRGMQFITLDRGWFGEDKFLRLVQLALTGSPKRTADHLMALLDEYLGRDINSQALLEHLATDGIKPRDLARDPSLPSAVRQLRNDFCNRLSDLLIANQWIPRPELERIVELATSDSPPRVVFVHGGAGSGKSGLLFHLTKELQGHGINVLPLSLSANPPSGPMDEYGRGLGLDATPDAALRAVSGQSRAVLLLDQLDALRLTTSGSAATWDACTRLMRSALSDPDTILIVACRTFDLEHDPQIAGWKERLEHADSCRTHSVPLDMLDANAIKPVLEQFSVDYDALPAPLRRLLLKPSALAAWYRLARTGSIQKELTSHAQLLRELLKALRQEVTREHGVSDGEVHSVLTRVREHMESTGHLTMPERRLGDIPTATNACCAVGLLTLTNNQLSFPHQSYLDHLVASAALDAAGSTAADIVAWVRSDQSLLMRDRLRQLLFLVREEDSAFAARTMEMLLLDPDVRFHLKQLVLGVLGHAHRICTEEVALVARLAEMDEWADHLRGAVLWRSVSWFDALNEAGVWQNLLASTDPEHRTAWHRTALSVIEHRPAETDHLLQPVFGSANATDLLGQILPHDPSLDSPRLAAVREQEVAAGRWAFPDIYLDRVAEKHPDRAIRLVAASIRGVIRKGLKSFDTNERIEGIREQSFEKQVLDAARTSGMTAYDAFSHLLRVIERLTTVAKSETNGTLDYRQSSTLSDIIKVLSTLTAHCVAGLGEHQSGEFQRILTSRTLDNSPTLTAAVAEGLAMAPAAVADAALMWLLDRPERLQVEDESRPYPKLLSLDIISQHAEYCSSQTLSKLEASLLAHSPRSELELYKWLRKQYPEELARGNPVGKQQHALLAAIPEATRSSAVQERLNSLEARFEKLQAIDSGHRSTGGWVRSPIPDDKLGHVSDRQWVTITQGRWNSSRWRQLDTDTVAESSTRQFASAFGQQAKVDPARFVQLMLRLPTSTPTEYLEELVHAFRDQATDISPCRQQDLDAVLALVIDNGDATVLRSACGMLQSHPTLDWGDEAWDLIISCAHHEDPLPEPALTDHVDDDSVLGGLETASLNCVRGNAALALAALSWKNSPRTRRALPMIEALATDPHPAVRVAAARAAFSVYTVDKDEGLRLFRCTCAHDDERILAASGVNQLLRYARWDFPGTLEDVFRRIARSSIPKVSKQGASWVAAEFHQRDGACRDTYLHCLAGDEHQRLGVASTLCELVLDELVNSVTVSEKLRIVFDDPSEAVRSAACDVFRNDDVLSSPVGPALATAYVASASFLEHPERLIISLANDGVDLAPYREIVLGIADRFAVELAAETRSIQNRLGRAGADVAKLLLRLYDSARKHSLPELAEHCLDRWDTLLRQRVGAAESHLETYV
ncbi:MAG: hypothetical protein Q9O74_00955 [Planctomycetota bacterium]|nr:hypothetical protein [Planctomycetota bacterium]